MTAAIHDGLRFTAISSEIKTTIARGTLFGLAGTSMLALLPLVARDHLKGGPIDDGILMAGFGAGALLAGITNTALRKRLSNERLFLLASFGCAACKFSLILATLALAFGGAGWVTAWSGIGVTVQLASPRWIVGRTISIYSAVTYGGLALGSWLWGTVSEHYSLSAALVWPAGATLLVAAIGLKFPIDDRFETELEPAGDFTTPCVSLGLKPRSGPILVTVEYAIPEQNVEAFLQVMRRRRPVQSRVGARHWALTRDVQDPSRWIEAYRTPTWADYLRLNHRLSAADKHLEGELLELSVESSPPRTSILIERPTRPVRKPDPTMPIVPQR